jgi:hypothetical protein
MERGMAAGQYVMIGKKVGSAAPQQPTTGARLLGGWRSGSAVAVARHSQPQKWIFKGVLRIHQWRGHPLRMQRRCVQG